MPNKTEYEELMAENLQLYREVAHLQLALQRTYQAYANANRIANAALEERADMSRKLHEATHAS